MLASDATESEYGIKPLPNKVTGYIEVGNVARSLDMSTRWVKDQVKAGHLSGFRLGNRIVIDRRSLEDFMAAREIKSDYPVKEH